MASREQEILDAARKLFREKGYYATTMQDIADAVGLQKASLYHYIRSKEALLLKIAGETMRLFHAELDRIEAAGGSAADQLAAAIRAHVRVVAEHQETLTVLFRESHALPPEHAEKVRGETGRYTRRLTALIARGVATGEFRPVDPGAACLAILGACNWMYRWYSADGRLSPAQIGEQFVQVILHGLLAPRGDDRPAGEPSPRPAAARSGANRPTAAGGEAVRSIPALDAPGPAGPLGA
ncbi:MULTISPECIES: TetR/AcrR family transcriptional regulator [Thermaerobacter]|uniref:TetR/AcrR family transcriptional regulator n=1 Tax=Thermaerobacter composti TaxID=554949 RepID=A0ABZ0QSS7_9FIRM|nr:MULTISPECIES: TetR/AcrR family transcriptional regulator [Thermaerobacter]WPD19503.1 TetR/AcrR family transcriptional regulator [Thermaerobacter composti]